MSEIEITLLPALRDNYAIVLHARNTGEVAIVDTPETQPILDFLAREKLTLNYIFNTHHHWDHTDNNLEIKEKTGCAIYGFAEDAARIPGIDRQLKAGETFTFGGQEVQIIAMPGHTIGSIAYYLPAQQVIFSGDTLFGLGCGRLFEGTPEQMFDTLSQFSALPAETLVYCAHEYTQMNGGFALELEPENAALVARMARVKHLREAGKPTVPLTLKEELETNPLLRWKSKELRKTLNMETAEDVAVFARVRKLRNQWKG
jgi:hydroxyacylglutathione hydrolase